MKFRRFEEMPVWQDARNLTKMVYGLTQGVKFSKDFGLRDQIRRAAVSIMSNIAEGYERATNKELLLFISYAKGSVGEVRCQLYVALDMNYISEKEFQGGYDLCLNVSVQLTKFAAYLRNDLKEK